ncbi:hypothetical protein FSP39_003695 [Pinctada imbricata]|uniref:Probable ATP-dependent RNA helicase DDX52 n=1 Tax=Pinctada imbricata TaxID=66713 RepID=A0AA89BR73_PINIB|nr:hypothetical protein FSP39_003695 [Pinctada imbricata]
MRIAISPGTTQHYGGMLCCDPGACAEAEKNRPSCALASIIPEIIKNTESHSHLLENKRKCCDQPDQPLKKLKGDENENDDDLSDDSTMEDDESDSETDDDDDDRFDDNNDDDSMENAQEIHLLGKITSKKKDKSLKSQKKVKTAEKMAAIRQEEVNHIRKQNRIHFHGTDVPEPFTDFEQLRTRYNISDTVLQNITTVGYNLPTAIQMQAIPTMLERREVMACAPTGSGKTAAFIIPILHHLQGPCKEGLRALILAPTRELAKQIKREFQSLSEGLGLKILFIEKSTTATKKLSASGGKNIDIMVSTPNRLVYMLRENPQVIDLTNIQWLVIDESDKLFEEGKTGFREQLAEIYRACENKNVRRAMFSATFAYDVEQWCKLNLDNVVQVYIGARNSATITIEQELLFVGQESGKLLAIRDMIKKGVAAPVLMFVQSKERAKELYQELAYDGMNIDIIHSDRSQEERDSVVKNFRLGKVWMLICTELMGRGIDFKGVNLVINFDLPTSAISYIHRIGRTGRAGRLGKAVTFFTENDSKNLRSIANVMIEAGCPVPDYMLKMKKPKKKVRRKLEKHVPKRPSISTAAKYDPKAKKKFRKFSKKKQGNSSDSKVEVSTAKGKRNKTNRKNVNRKFKPESKLKNVKNDMNHQITPVGAAGKKTGNTQKVQNQKQKDFNKKRAKVVRSEKKRDFDKSKNQEKSKKKGKGHFKKKLKKKAGT